MSKVSQYTRACVRQGEKILILKNGLEMKSLNFLHDHYRFGRILYEICQEKDKIKHIIPAENVFKSIRLLKMRKGN